MDPNVIGHRRNSDGPHSPNYRRIVVLSLTCPSLGNGLGIGMADFTTRHFVDSYDPNVSYINLLTASEPDPEATRAKIQSRSHSTLTAKRPKSLYSHPSAVRTHGCAASTIQRCSTRFGRRRACWMKCNRIRS